MVLNVNIYTHFEPQKTRKALKGCALFHFLYSVFSVLSVVKLSLEIYEKIWVIDYSSNIDVK